MPIQPPLMKISMDLYKHIQVNTLFKGCNVCNPDGLIKLKSSKIRTKQEANHEK